MAEYFSHLTMLKFHLLLLLAASCVAAPLPGVNSNSSLQNESPVIIKFENETNLDFLNRIKDKCSQFQPQVVLDACKAKQDSTCNLAVNLMTLACQKYPDMDVPQDVKIEVKANESLCTELKSSTTQKFFVLLSMGKKPGSTNLNFTDLQILNNNCESICKNTPELCRNALHTIKLVETYFMSSLSSTSSPVPEEELMPSKASAGTKMADTPSLASTKEPVKPTISSNTSVVSSAPKVDVQQTSFAEKSSSSTGNEIPISSSSIVGTGDQVTSSKNPMAVSANDEILGEDPDYVEPPPMPDVSIANEDDENQENQPVLEDKEDQEQPIDRDDDLDDDQLADPNTQSEEAVKQELAPKEAIPNRVAEPHMKTSTYAIGETAEDTHFFVYFLVALVLTITGYLAFHNKHKILALLLEGRRRRVTSTRSGRSAAYRKLDSNLEEVMTSSRKAGASDIIY